MKKIFLVILLSAISSGIVFSQIPVIASLSDLSAPVNAVVGISGFGFNSTPSNLKVRFGSAEAEIISATGSFIEVKVPAGTSASVVSVTNLVSGFTGYSSKLFFISFSGDGGVQPPIEKFVFASVEELFDLEIADFDQDGKNDIVTTKIGRNDIPSDILIYHNTATTNTITMSVLDKNTNPELDIGNPSSNVAHGDIDGDGKTDIAVTRGGNTRNVVYIFRNISTIGNIKFAVKKTYLLATGSLSRRVLIKDIDMDGRPEVLVTNSINNEIAIFKNNSSKGLINLSSIPEIVTSGVAPSTNGLAVEDLNLDGKPEIVITPFLDENVYVLKNQSTTTNISFSDPLVLPVSGNLNNIAVGDLNNDGKNDIIVTKTQQNEITILLNNSDANLSFEPAQSLPANAGPWGLNLLDFEGNGKLDIMVSSTSGDSFTYFENTSNATDLTFTKVDYIQSKKSRNIKSADLSNDGKPDLVITAYDDVTRTYELVVIRNNFCFQPDILQGSDLTICNGQTIRLEATTALDVTYVWTLDGAEQKTGPESFIDIILPGKYIVTAKTESDICINASEEMNVVANAATVPPDPIAANSGPGCLGNTINLTTPEVANVSYEWTGPAGFASTLQNPVLDNLTADMSGKYEVLLVNPEGCKSNVAGATIVEAILPPVFTILSDIPATFCEGNSAILSIIEVADYTYQWQQDLNDIPGATNATYTATNPGSYSMVATSTVSSCITASDSFVIATFPPPVSGFTSSEKFCTGVEVQFTNTSLVDATLNVSYNWNFGDGTTSNAADTTYTYTTSGSYSVSLFVTYDDFNCSDKFTQEIVVNDPTPFVLESTGVNPFCEGDSLLLTVPGNYDTYLWNDSSTEATLVVKSAGTFSAFATNSVGCAWIESITVETLTSPNITASSESDIISLGQSVQLNVEGGVDYLWSPGAALNDSTIADPVATPEGTTTYSVIGTDIEGCKGSDELTIEVEDTGDKLPVVAPRMFSPNGDTIDDLWIITNMLNFPDCKIVVFDRNGSNVFEAQPYKNDWDGTDLNGNHVPEGAYFFVISCNDGKSATGSVSIIR